MIRIFTRYYSLFFLFCLLSPPSFAVPVGIDLGVDLSADRTLFENTLQSMPNGDFAVSGFSQSSPGTELQLTPNQYNWKSQLLITQSFQRREGLTFEGSVFIPHESYKAVMVGFHDGVTNGTEGIQHGFYFFDNGGGISVSARNSGAAQAMPTEHYDNSSSAGSWFDYQIVLHSSGATYSVKRSSEETYTNILTYDGGFNLSVLYIGVQANRTSSATNTFTAHKNWKVYQSLTLFVNKNVIGGDGSGNSWTNAVSELADALKWAKENESHWTIESPLKIWVAGGVYKPMYDPSGNDGGRNNTFLMVGNVQVYGGFAGAESYLGARDLSLKTNATILSGDINNNDVVTGTGSTLNFSNNSENSYHVVLAAGNVSNALLDGFTISGGNADGSGNTIVSSVAIYQSRGAGIYCRVASPKFNYIIVTSNTADSYGGATYNDDGASTTYMNTLITKNRGGLGAGMCNHSSPVLINVSISGNKSTDLGGGIYNSGSAPKIFNTIIYGNVAANSGPEISNENSSNPTFVNSLILGSGGSASWQTAFGTDGGDNIDADPLFFATENLVPKSSSPTVNNGNNQSYIDLNGNLTDVDLAGNTRVRETIIDIGAYEFAAQQPSFSGFSDIIKANGDEDFMLSPPLSDSDGAFTYTSSDENVATISGNTVTIIGVGTAEITATQASTANYKAGEIKLNLTVEETLPVSLIIFTAKAEGQNALLSWTTTMESKNNKFIIYRRGDDGVFMQIGEKAGAGTSSARNNYSFYDKHPLSGYNYYRLAQVDMNGEETILEERVISFRLSDLSVKVYPNPTTDKINIAFEAGRFNNLRVTDLSGNILQHWETNITESSKTLSLADYASGTYIIHLTGNGESRAIKVLKEF